MPKITPIRTEEDYTAAMTRIEVLWGAKAGTAKGDELDILLALVRVYEDQHHAIEAPDPIALLHHIMEAQGLRPTDLTAFIGRSGRVSEILNRHRHLTLPMIRMPH